MKTKSSKEELDKLTKLGSKWAKKNKVDEEEVVKRVHKFRNVKN